MAHGFDAVIDRGLDYMKARYGEGAVERAILMTQHFQVEVPAWQLWAGFGGGGRFEKGGSGGAARTTAEIAEDAGLLFRLTKSCPTFGMHILWFFSKDGMEGDFELAKKVRDELEGNGVHMGSISPTYFLAGSEDGSFTSQDAGVRKRYVEQTALGAKIAAELANGLLTLWFPDGTNYPGQRSLQDKIGLMKECMTGFWGLVDSNTKGKIDKVLVEYKVFEPGTYSTTVPDWGTALLLSTLVPEKGGVLVDLGHHHHGTNIEQIVAHLLTFGIKGGFHFNTRYAADDDHSVQADYEMACIFAELVKGDVIMGKDAKRNWAFAIDQMARAERRIPSILKSIDALKRSVAKAALIDAGPLAECRKNIDIIGANAAWELALLHADATPIVMESYRRLGLHPDPMTAYLESGYQDSIEKSRA